MPIQIQTPGSLEDIEREIHSFEEQYGITSVDFSDRAQSDQFVSEFDAIEWNFLLMQKKFLEDACSSKMISMGRFMTRTGEVETSQVYEKIAA